MKAPEGFGVAGYMKVNKALYGLKQSGKAWFDKLNTTLTSLYFKQLHGDCCVYIHKSCNLVIGPYVYDLVICGKLTSDIIKLKQQLSSHFPIKDLGLIGTSQYRIDKIRSFGLHDSNSHSSPIEGYSGILPANENEPLVDDSAYASAVGSLGYAANGTRPDSSYAVSQLASFNASPTQRHWASVCRVMRYLKGTKDYCITYSYGPVSDDLTSKLMATSFSDSDYASDISTRRSVSGFLLMLGGCPISWQSRRQKSVATSTAETEYIVLFESSKYAIWITGFLKELCVFNDLVDQKGVLTLTDNQSALAIASGTNSRKTKHIDVAFHFTRECLNHGHINIQYIPSKKMLADLLTKSLPPSKLTPLCEQIFPVKSS
ncbi:hypothetical protein K3495_g2787 [Podosphaera aphanis]|nr:hypothetical protein K3495_g2787 [Podosphaera aphanis]